jgi:histidinol-phosphatase (PHP family)
MCDVIMLDYHLHTRLCKHATGEIGDYIETAIQSGLKEICFTDHIPLPLDFDCAHRMTRNEMDLYLKWIERARIDYPQIEILTGIEADYYEGFENYLDQFLASYNFDIVIMSVHYVKQWSDGNWVFNYHFPDKTISRVYEEYLDTMIKGIKTGLFDIAGHVDIIKRNRISLLKVLPEKVAEVLGALKKANMAIEINSSGFRKDAGECYPGVDWLSEIRKVDLPVTVGSDAHSPEQVAFRFDEVYRQIRINNIEAPVAFRQRRMIPVSRLT